MSDAYELSSISPPSDFELEDMPRPSILLVDDRTDNLIATSKTLAKLDAEVVTAQSGSEALALCLRRHFAVILMDVQMPIMDGFETAELLSQSVETRDIPIIFLTAISKDEHHVFKGYKSGAVDYISKPVDPAILLAKVRVFIALENQRITIGCMASRLKQLNFRNTLILDSAAMGIIGIDGEGCLNFLNPAAQRLLLASENLIGTAVLPLLDGPDLVNSPWLSHPFREACIQQQKLHMPDTQMYQTTGNPFPAEFTFTPMPADRGATGGVLIFQNISSRKVIADQLDKMAKYDDLTGVANRRLFRDTLEKRLAGARRYGRKIGLLYIDIDDFKEVNEKYGHQAGDVLLQLFCERVLSQLRHDDTVGRLGGDEFALLIDGCSDKVGLFALAKKLVKACSATYLVEGRPVNVGISVGIALFPEQADDIESLFQAADKAMYSVKKSTKNDFALFHTAMQA